MGIKNFWSLHVDEALVASELKKRLSNDYEVFFPFNSQLKDIDLIIYNVKNHKTKTVQVKSSQGYGSGGSNSSGHLVPKNKINPKTVDYFIFTSYFEVRQKKKNKMNIETHYVVIPTQKLLDLVNKTKIISKGICKFSFYLESDNTLWEYWKPHMKSVYKKDGVSYEKYHNNIKSIINF